MSRHTFGQSPSDWTFTVGTADAATLAGGVALTMWDSQTSGTQITDLLDAAGTPITTVTSSSGGTGLPKGTVPLFYGPDGVTQLWADAGGGYRSLLTSHDGFATLEDARFGQIAGLTVSGSAAAGLYPRATSSTGVTWTADGTTDMINAKSPAYGGGAKGDGTTDDRAAIQAAIDTAAGSGGGTVYLPKGTYRIGNALVLKTGVYLRGAGATGWPGRFTSPMCSIKPLGSFSGECAISMLGADITLSGTNEGRMKISDLELDGSSLPAGSVSGIHAQGEVMDVQLSHVVIKSFTHNGIHTNVGSGTKAPHDWFMDSVVAYGNASYGFSMSMTDGYIRDCVASTNGNDGWLLGPFGSLAFEGCQALFNGGNGFTINGGTQVGNLTCVGLVTDRNHSDGIHVGPSSGSGSGPFIFSGITLNRDGKNSNSGGGGYAGFSANGCANPIIVSGLVVNTGLDDDGSGVNSPQYGAYFSGNAFVSVASGYVHGNTTGWKDDGTNTVIHRGINIAEATGSKTSPTFVYGNGVQTTDGTLDVPQHAIGVAHPREHTAITWAYDPALVNNGSAGTAGTLYLVGLYVNRTVTATKLYWGIASAGSGAVAGQSFVSLFNSSGTKLADVGVDARITTTGAFTETISAALTPGLYWVGILINASTMPQTYKAANTAASLVNFGLTGTAASLRFATNGTGLTATPASITPSSNTSAQQAYWAALG